jgi:hypothetical protein
MSDLSGTSSAFVYGDVGEDIIDEDEDSFEYASELEDLLEGGEVSSPEAMESKGNFGKFIHYLSISI